MARYIASVLIVVDADEAAEAADAFSGALSENLKYGGAIVEWSYAAENGRYIHPRRVPDSAPTDLEDADLTELLKESVEESILA